MLLVPLQLPRLSGHFSNIAIWFLYQEVWKEHEVKVAILLEQLRSGASTDIFRSLYQDLAKLKAEVYLIRLHPYLRRQAFGPSGLRATLLGPPGQS
jgi:hypothetical protein